MPRRQGPLHPDLKRQLVLWLTSTALFALGVTALGTTVLWHPTPDASWQVALHELALQLWPFALTTSLAVLLYERLLRDSFIAELINISGPRIVEALLPRQVITTFLARIYGSDSSNYDAIIGILGGPGRLPDGKDLTISKRTKVNYRLSSEPPEEVPGTYFLQSTVEYTFRNRLEDFRLVLFATCDVSLRDLIAPGSNVPLFDWWYIPDDSLFLESVANLVENVALELGYTDSAGDTQRALMANVNLTQIHRRNWPRYLSFFSGRMGAVPRKDPRDFADTLRVYECNLTRHPNVLHEMRSVETVVVRSQTLQKTDDRFCYWQAPFPCYVEDIRFDVSGLRPNDATRVHLFQVLPFMIRAGRINDDWTPPRDLDSLRVDSWMLPGHGVALLWKEA